MLAKERQNAIVEEVNAQGSVLVKELAEKYQVTEDSIRKDLTILQNQGLLKKTYGGAIKNHEKMTDYFLAQRIGKNVEQKTIIAKKALSCIEEKDMIFLDVSSTNVQLARMIIEENLNVTVVTNNIEIMLLFANSNFPNFQFIAGTLNKEHDSFVGSVSDAWISQFHFDKVFMSSVGVDVANNCVYNHDVVGGLTKRCIMENGEKVYGLLETYKLGLEGNYKYAQVTDFDVFITDIPLNKKQSDAFKKKGITLL